MALFDKQDDDLSNYGELVSVEAFSAITKNLNYLIDSMPVGSIIPILAGMPGVPTPDPRLWQLCDGSMITEQRSELHDNPTPDFKDRYSKGADSPGLAGQTGGANEKSFNHDHGGITSFYDNADNSEFGVNFLTFHPHAHLISFDLPGTNNVEPSHFRVLHYIKIA